MSKSYRAEQDVCISGWECGTEIELKLVVSFTVHPGSKETLVDPAEEPSIEVDKFNFFEVKNGKPSPDAATLPVWMINRFTESHSFNEWLMSEAAEQHQSALEDAADARREDARMDDRS